MLNIKMMLYDGEGTQSKPMMQQSSQSQCQGPGQWPRKLHSVVWQKRGTSTILAFSKHSVNNTRIFAQVNSTFATHIMSW